MKLPKTILVKRAKKKKRKKKKRKIVRRRIMLQRKMAKQSPSQRLNQSPNPRQKQLQPKRKRRTTLRRRKLMNQKKKKIQMRNRLHPRPRKRGVDPQLKPPLKRNRHLKRNLKNASAHLNFQKVSQKATLAMKKKPVVTMNLMRGSNPRKLSVEGFVAQRKNEKGVVQTPLGRRKVVLLQKKKCSMKNHLHPLQRKRGARKADPQQNPSMWT